ncbi:DUF11 domain-containing protein [Nostoc parmelioides]|uniref:Isopeptide-forming domain-containing fimbrial protein n=1 Tax=Nostoc parmelioides FACHB-3921 TaxID=2692909 RepID=A0ABR8BJH2_9NOSO|nr:DUF11 domain-containing protein [Nostoc parmelioides]MBD2253282.1 isopeptide-forming domain-containing fimbrial protein [Nostoc parmelioides FACHB-3921]
MKYLFNYLKAIATIKIYRNDRFSATVGNLNKKTMKKPLTSSRRKLWLSSLGFFVCIFGNSIQPSWAEGSKELISDGGYRPYLEWSNLTAAGIVRKTTLKVYVEVGETVNLGSSVATSFSNPQDIVYRSPFNGQNGSCDVLATGFGFIDTIAKETAGPLPNSGGYIPCSFVATETGIYEVEFRSVNTSGSGNPPPRDVTVQFPTDGTQLSGVAAWDITVRSNGVAKKGRVFTNYIAMNMGSNASSGNPIALNSKLYIQTKDGYRYETDMNGIDPFGFIFFANNRGFIDKTNNSTVYRSAGGATNNDLIFSGNVRVQDPTVADTATDITHLVFFNRPDNSTLNYLGISTLATVPTVPTSFKFTGGTGGSGNQAPVGVGGNFSFNAVSTGSYQIIIDTNTDNIYDPSVDRVLQNVLSVGSNVVFWDGKDASGTNLPPRPNNDPYNAIITTRSGEYHFPMLDAENNPLGFKITMENPPTAFPSLVDMNGQPIGATTVYYNDSNYVTANGTTINLNGTGATSPRNAARGINSALGEHEFSGGYGDFKGIDTWTYFPSQAINTPLVITTSNQANVRGTKSVRFLTDNDNSGTVTVGDRIEYTITYSNLSPGNSNAINFVINDSLPSQLTFVSAAITTATSGNNITLNPSYNGAGVVTLTNSGTLGVNDTITIKITATINNANGGNPISNQANATFNTPDNSTGTVGTVFTDADSAGATSNPPTLGNSFLQIADNGVNTGNNPTSTADDDPTLFTASNAISSSPNLLLTKRITRVNNQDLNDIVDGRSDVPSNASNYVPEPYATNDSDSKWPVGYLRGLINAGVVKPGDELEYTIYFLSNGLSNVTKVKLCDLVPTNVNFIPNAFNSLTPNDGGLSGTDQGIGLAIGSTIPTVYLSNVADSDRATFYPANDPNTPSVCNNIGSNTNGALVVEITRNLILPNLPPATSSGNPPESYGFVRFRGKVK